MNTVDRQGGLIARMLIVVVLFAAVLVAFLAPRDAQGGVVVDRTSTAASNSAAAGAPGNAAPNQGYHYGARDLKGATPQQVGQFIHEYLVARGFDMNGSSVVLKAIPVTAREYTALGLGCLPSPVAIEEPPLVLAILKGNFDFRAWAAAPTISKIFRPTHYVALVFDTWSASPVSWLSDFDGGVVGQALNDPTLPNRPRPEVVCATPIPVSQRTLHYGQEAPGFTSPPPGPASQQAHNATPTAATAPTPPANVPPPVPTNQQIGGAAPTLPTNVPPPVPTSAASP